MKLSTVYAESVNKRRGVRINAKSSKFKVSDLIISHLKRRAKNDRVSINRANSTQYGGRDL